MLGRGERVEVPCAVTIFPADIDQPAPRVGASAPTTSSAGPRCRAAGTSPRHEEPELLAADIREFFRPLR